MALNNRFQEVFGNTPILGMIHLAGEDPVSRALEELRVYQKKGIDGAIIENYHSPPEVVIETLDSLKDQDLNMVLGMNMLPNEFQFSLPLATQYGLDFVQLDNIAGNYDAGRLMAEGYKVVKGKNPEVIVIGGVWPKYYTPVQGSDLEKDLEEGSQRAEAIVVTGSGTGMTTPLEKIKEFRRILGKKKPLIVGAGLTPENAYNSLMLADGAIVGSYFKVNGRDTMNPLDEKRIDKFMDVVRDVRKKKQGFLRNLLERW